MIPAATEWGYAPYEVFQRSDRQQVRSSLRRRMLIAFTTARNGSSSTARPQAQAGSAARLAIGLRRSTACKTSFRTARSSIFTSPGTETTFARAHARLCRASLVPSSGNMPHEWECNGLRRNQAHLVSTVNGSAAFGGTPDDRSVIAAIKDLKGRGLAGLLYAVHSDGYSGREHACPIPMAGGTGQAVYPWRGRITKDYGTADKTPQAGGGGCLLRGAIPEFRFALRGPVRGRRGRGRVSARHASFAA